jgi:hypothetical protein
MKTSEVYNWSNQPILRQEIASSSYLMIVEALEVADSQHNSIPVSGTISLVV